MFPGWAHTIKETSFFWHVSMCFPKRLGWCLSKIRVAYHLWLLLNLSSTLYPKLCRQTREQNSSIIRFNSGWRITKSISSQQKMKISKQASLNVSIGLWKQSYGAILPIITPWPTQTYWSLWWMFIITLHIAVLVWHLMMSHLQIKDGYGSDFMLTQCLIKNLPCALGTQFASVRQGVHSKRVIRLSGLKKSSPSWKGRVHNLPHLCWQITAAKC